MERVLERGILSEAKGMRHVASDDLRVGGGVESVGGQVLGGGGVNDMSMRGKVWVSRGRGRGGESGS